MNIRQAFIEGIKAANDALTLSFWAGLILPDEPADFCQPWLDDNGDSTGHPPESLGDDGNLAATMKIGIPGEQPVPSEPAPKLLSVRCHNDTVNLGDYAVITVEATNKGGEANWQTIAVSFPDNPEDVQIVDHNMDGARVWKPGEEVWADYGGYKIRLEYPLLEGARYSWLKDEKHLIQARVKPESAGDFTFYVKSVAGRQPDGECASWDPESGTIEDQQHEYVYFYTSLSIQTPSLISPQNNTTIHTTTPTFVWSNVSNADYYGLYISEPPYGPSNLVFDSEEYYGAIYGNSLTLPNEILTNGITYYWNMRSHNSSGWSDGFSASFCFTVETGEIEVSGSITDNETWTAENTYIVTDNITIENNAKLTIEAGVKVKFNQYRTMYVNGTLDAQGDPDQYIIFTSAKSTAEEGNWGGIFFGSTSTNNTLDYCEIKYAGYQTYYMNNSWITGIGVYSSSVIITNSIFSHIKGNAISCYAGASPTINGNSVSFSGNYFIWTDVSSVPHLKISDNNATGGTTNSVEVKGGSVLIDAIWPNHGIPYIISGDLTVNAETIFTLEAGTVLKFAELRVLYVNGSLRAQGNSDQHILFTSAASTPQERDWRGIYFGSTSIEDTLDYCEIKYAGYENYYMGNYRYAGIVCYSCSPIIKNSIFSHNYMRSIACYEGAGPTISENTVSYSGNYFIGADISSVPNLKIGTNYVTGGTKNAIEVWGGTILVNSTWPNQEIPYIIQSNITVDEDIEFKLMPGNILKFTEQKVLYIGGKLNSCGTNENHIVFTSAKSTPQERDWCGIYFGSTSIENTLDYCEIKYAGDYNNYMGNSCYAGIVCYSCSPTIKNCVISNNFKNGIYTLNSSNPIISPNNSIFKNSEFGVYNQDPSITIDATHNFWGYATGPYNSITNPNGAGNAVSDYVDYNPWLTSWTEIKYDDISANIPDQFYLFQNYPNPFNPTTTIRYAIPKKTHVSLTIYNTAGQVVEVLENQSKEPGYYSVHLDASKLGSGVYFYQIQAGDPSSGSRQVFTEVKKCVLIK
ncbi:MAG: T9SS type A sorting domain-containing protein [Bacteroidetes bacterium]|nr:T9SS type A sorting domain-containing protein [Bacteroidota bacterium]